MVILLDIAISCRYNNIRGVYMLSEWVKCPKCGYPHFIKKREDTVLKMFPAYCKGCKNEILVNLEPKSHKAVV